MTTSIQHGHRGRRWLAGVAVAAVLVVLLAACTRAPSASNPAESRPGGSRAQGQPPAAIRGDLVGLVLIGGSLTREGDGVTLRFTVANRGRESVTIGDLLGPNGLAAPATFEASGAYLFDGNAHKRYDVVRDGEACRCAKVPLGIDPGQALELFASFPDPGQTGELSAIVPHFPPLDGLRIQS
jgi:hypothetical protein